MSEWGWESSQSPGDSPVLPPLPVKSSELQAIKTELAQIKSNIDALLGRLEQIAEEQKANPGQLPRILPLVQVTRGPRRRVRGGQCMAQRGAMASHPTWTHCVEAELLPKCCPGSYPRLNFIPLFTILFPQDGKKKGDSGNGSSGGSSRPLAPQEDTTSEAGTPQGEAQARDDGDEEGLLTHSEEELVRARLEG